MPDTTTAPADPLTAVSDPQHIRRMIGERSADLSALRRLLKVAERRQRQLNLLSIRLPTATTPARTTSPAA